MAVVGLMHASKDGETLGRRLEGLARAIIKLTKPDPEGQPERRKFWVDRANFKEPPELGVTMREDGCVFDSNPPVEPESGHGGRPRKESLEAERFLTERLTKGDRKWAELINEFESTGGSKGTLFNARKAMKDAGRLTWDDKAKPQILKLVNNSQEGQEPCF